ncbi:MAG: type II toxin-antitoxin system HipA family toxin [Blastocatellia bacterium]
MTTLAEVKLWGRTIGAVSLEDRSNVAAFEYTPEFVTSGIEVSPIVMPLSESIYVFPELPRATFHGLPGLLADSLPDKFGNALIDAWLATQGRSADSFNAVERLCYTGSRGMGALEFFPSKRPREMASRKIEIEALVKLASDVLNQRSSLDTTFDDPDSLRDILRVGTSAGGARAKAVIAWNRKTNDVRSGQGRASDGFEYWLLKFDGVSENRDKERADPQGYGAIEYAYYLMALEAGIQMSECRLLEENGRRHFMTKRFDRKDNGEKIHMLSLSGLAHFDFNNAGAYGYEQAMLIMRQLKLPTSAIEEMFRRMTFNIVARNQDDHVKNIAFLMDKEGKWSLAPAFDVAYSFNPAGLWTSSHQMTMNGKRDGFSMSDFKACSEAVSLKRGCADSIVAEVRKAVEKWPEFAGAAKVTDSWKTQIQENLRLELSSI